MVTAYNLQREGCYFEGKISLEDYSRISDIKKWMNFIEIFMDILRKIIFL
jgi:hypothetical protein